MSTDSTDVSHASTGELETDFHYRDKIAAVEPYGVDAIPDSERHGKPVSQFFIWFAAGMNFPIMVLGFLAVSYGLSLTSSVTAIVAGSLVGSIVMGILSRMGGRLGVAQQIQARGPLGFLRQLPPGRLRQCVCRHRLGRGHRDPRRPGPAGPGSRHPVLARHASPRRPAAHRRRVRLQHDPLPRADPGSGAVFRLPFDHRGLGEPRMAGWLRYQSSMRPTGSGGVGGWITFGGFFLSFLIAWWPFASDYSRYLPDEDHINRATGFWTFAGNFISLSWLGIAGALLGSSAATGESPIDALFRLTGPYHVPALLAVLISSFSQNFLNVYGGAISIQTLRIPVSRRTAVILICAAAYLISLWASAGFEAKFKTFLFLGAYLIAPFGAVLLLDYVLGHRHDRARIAELYDSRRILEWGFVAWLIGAAASMPFWNLSFFVGPLAKAHPEWGDLSYFVGFAVAALVYIATYRLPPLWHRKTPVFHDQHSLYAASVSPDHPPTSNNEPTAQK